MEGPKCFRSPRNKTPDTGISKSSKRHPKKPLGKFVYTQKPLGRFVHKKTVILALRVIQERASLTVILLYPCENRRSLGMDIDKMNINQMGTNHLLT